jgi:alpha-galactosidase
MTLETEVKHQREEGPGVRYRSGLTIYDEALVDGRLVGRYWSASGSIKPERHLEDEKRIRDVLPTEAFRLRIEEHELDRGWRWVASREAPLDSPVRHVVVELEQEQVPIALKVHTCFDGSPFLVRWLEITNGADHPVALTDVVAFAGLTWWVHGFDEYVGPDCPVFSLGYYRRSRQLEEGDFVWEALRSGTKVVEGRGGRSGHGRPSFWLRNETNGETFVVELAWSGNWCFEVTVEQGDLDRGPLGVNRPPVQDARAFFRIGPYAADPALRVLAPGETVETPAVHIGHLHADLDGCAQALHQHVRTHVLPAQLPGKNQLVEANHRGYICDHENEAGIIRELDIAADLGAETFVIDAGWYGPEPNRWQVNVGDWYAGSWLPRDLYPIVEHAHAKGLLFGLWVEIESIGASSKLLREHPDWVLRRNGEPIANGRHLDVANPVVAEWMEAQLVDVISRYNLDLFRLDYNTHVFDGGNRIQDGFLENTIWRHVEAIWRIFARLRQRFPNVIFENCASGGGRLDLGMLRYFQITEISDWMRAPRSLKILNGLSLSLPPEICLRTFGTEVPDHYLYGDLDYQIRSCLFGHPILRGIAPSLDAIGEPRRRRIVHALDLYKRFIRPILPNAKVYHHTPELPLFGPSPWCVLEYATPDGAREVAGIFRLTGPSDGIYRYRPRGLRAGARYRVTFDNTGDVVELSGLELQRDGLELRLASPLTSELLTIEVG